MSARPQLLDHRGNPMALSATAHEAADHLGHELASWHPGSYSADSALLPELERLRDRTADLVRNNGIASGAVQTHIDNVIGSGLMLDARPDRRALGLKDDERAEEMDEIEDEIEAKFDSWAQDLGCHVDASRRSRFSGLLAKAYRSYVTQFEILATAEWLVRPGTRYRTAIQMIDPARLCNPMGWIDDERLRAGVELDGMGAPSAYWIASYGPGERLLRREFQTWKRVPRETPWGRALVLHVFDDDMAGQSRGKNGLVSVLAKHKMVDKFERVSLEAAAFNAMYAAYIQSSLDWPSVAEMIGAGADTDPTLKYLGNAAEFHKEGHIRFNGLKIPHLFPGEELKHLAPQHPTPAFNAFEEAALRYLAAGWNLTYEQLSRDYSKTNYSSARAAMLEGWRFFSGKQHFIGGWFATQIYALWFEEAVELGEIVLPSWAPGFYDARTSWTRCGWIGPGRGHIDPLKEANATKVEYSMGLTTLQIEAGLRGRRWQDLVDQRAQERRYMRRRGIDPAEFNGPTPVEQPPDMPEERRGNEQRQEASA